MGLIVIITLLIPVFKIFNNKADITGKISQYTSSFQSQVSYADAKELQNSISLSTRAKFEDNLKQVIEERIKEKTNKTYIVSSMEIIYDSKGAYSGFKSIKLKKTDDSKTIKPVDKIIIKETSSSEDMNLKDQKVLNVLVSDFEIKPSVIKFVK